MNSVIIKCPEMKHIRLFPLWGSYILAIGLIVILQFTAFASSDEEFITTIILINRQAELVDIDSSGEILKRHVAIPDYFSSGRSHRSSLRKSLQLIKDYGLFNDHSLPGGSDLPAICLQSFMGNPEVSKESSEMNNLYNTMSYPLKSEEDLSFISLLGKGQDRFHHDFGIIAIRKLNHDISMLDHFYPPISFIQGSLIKQQMKRPGRSNVDVIHRDKV